MLLFNKHHSKLVNIYGTKQNDLVKVQITDTHLIYYFCYDMLKGRNRTQWEIHMHPVQ